MADVAQHASERLDSPSSNHDSASPIPPADSRADLQSPVPTPPPKEVLSTLYEQRQKCELRRLLKHTCPELKGLGDALEEEFADILNSGITADAAYQGEVQSRRWLFENGAVNTGESNHKQTERSVQGEHTFGQLLSCFQDEGSVDGEKEQTSYPELNTAPQKQGEALNEEENFRVDVKATRKMFEGQSAASFKDNLEDLFPGRVVIADEEKGAVLKQKKDFETYQNDSGRINSPFSIADITEVDQDVCEVYKGISKAKEIFETGFFKENISCANEHQTIDDETVKTNVRNRTQMFESTPLDRINWQKEEESKTTEERMCKTLSSLYTFNVIQSQGTVLEATEAGHVRRANYVLTENEGPEILHEEVVMGSMKSILLQILAKVNLNPLIALLKEDDQGNVEIQTVDVPTYHLPFTVNQDKEYRTTVMVQVIEDLLGQETCPGKGVLLQEHEAGSVKIVVYVLFRHDVHDGTVLNMMESKDIHVLLSGKDDDNPNACSPPPSIQTDAPRSDRLEGNGNVKLLRSCIENGDLDYLKNLQKSPSDEDLRERTAEEEQSVISKGNLKTLKAMFTPNSDSGSTSAQLHKPVQETLKNKHAGTEGCIADNMNVSCQEVKPDGLDSVFLTELVHPGEEESNLEEAMKSLHQATMEARSLQQSVQEKQEDNLPLPPDDQYLTEIMSEGYISETESVLSFETGQQAGMDESLKGSVQSALDSLGKSSFNVNKGDFKAAMIYRNSGKSHTEQKKATDVKAVKMSADMTVKACPSSFMTEQVTVETQHASQGQSANKPSACSPLINQTQPPESKTPLRSKPAIPLKPDHLKTIPCASKTSNHETKSDKPEQRCEEPVELHDALFKKEEQSEPAGVPPLNGNNPDNNPSQGLHPEGQVLTEQEGQRNQNGAGPGFHASLQNFGVKTGPAMPPVKPKRLKMATDSTEQQNTTKPDEGEPKGQPESTVTMREKKGRRESEEERRQRLSVHMDEIMRGNTSTAMEIIDKLRKQDELKSILLKVEEIEEDTSQEHEGDIRKIFESVPDWVAPKNAEVEKKVGKVETISESEVLSSMQVAYGDLERASAAINTLKEQTLSRLMEIEKTIKKALYSVSTLKSDSDIAGLSGLFKESMMSGQFSPVSGNVRKISIGSSKSAKPQTPSNQDVPQKSATETPVHAERSKSELGPPAIKPRAASPSSPSFISIQSTARKNPEKAQTSTYNAPAANEKRQVSTLEVKTGPKKETVIGTKTIREKYEETDSFGNTFYSSKTSTVVTTQADTKSCFRGQLVGNPNTPEVVFPRIKTTSVNGDQASS
ncbi:LIM domain-containing protein [Trichomycterus rosablanca]|uniref:LIM domain-containing protein n=1 Tax=Trichomycterus rosablanca TaxID=2290929 RepID=UPI002F35A935